MAHIHPVGRPSIPRTTMVYNENSACVNSRHHIHRSTEKKIRFIGIPSVEKRRVFSSHQSSDVVFFDEEDDSKGHMMRHSSSSAEETLLAEQARKLFSICDNGNKGYIGKSDLKALEELISRREMTSLERRLGDSFVDEKQFSHIMQALVAESSSGLSPQLSRSPQGFSGGLTLADELQAATEPRQPIHDPLADMIRQQLEDNCYPYSVKNPARDENIMIKKPHFRPIEPDASSRAVAAQSLADELHEAELTSPGQSSQSEIDMRTPDRIFKVVFVGDSAVGKTCFLHRFRAITKQYFRKADGVVLMFDVTSEQSLLNVRNWVDSVRAGVDDSTVLCLVGNKVDLFGNDSSRTSVYKEGKRLAEEFGMSFFETSAFTGYGIDNCMRIMAERLQQREEYQLEEALKLEMTPQDKKRSWCCL